jgi:tetratricopeptide (TPR) repeat protein
MDETFELNHKHAAALCQEYIKRWPDDAAGYAYLARVYWSEEIATRQLLSLDRLADDDFFSDSSPFKVAVQPAMEMRFRKASEEAMAKGRARLRSNAGDRSARFAMGVAYQNLASFEAALKTNWWQAVRNGDQALKYHGELVSSPLPVADAHVTTGIYQYAVGSVPWKFRWLSFLLGYHGDKAAGIRELEIAATQGVLAAGDARLLLVLLHTLDKQFDAAYAQLNTLHAQYPRNYLLQLEMGATAARRGRPVEAEAIYQDILRQVDLKQNGFERLDHAVVFNRLGALARDGHHLDVAERWLRRSIDEAGAAPRTRTVARLELGKTLDLLGRRSEALTLYRTVQAAEDFAGSRREAEMLIKKPFLARVN